MTDRLGASLANDWTVKFLPTPPAVLDTRPPSPNQCKGHKGAEFGIGSVARTSRLTVTRKLLYGLHADAFEQHSLICLDIATPRPILPARRTSRRVGKERDESRRRPAQIAGILKANIAGKAVFLGGDLNTTPKPGD